MNTLTRLAAPALLLLTSTATLAGTAVIEAGSGKDVHRVDLEYRPGLLRMQPQGAEEGTMIARDGKVYTVGQGMVIEISSVMGMMGEQLANTASNGPDDVRRFVGFNNTGRRETVAGIGGEVYVLQYEDGNGKVVSEEMVVSKDAKARELSEAMEGMTTSMRAAMKKAETAEERKLSAALKGYGVLRFGQDFRVVSLSDKTPAASRFELPAAPTQMPDLGGMFGAGAGASAEASAGSEGGGGIGKALGGLFGGKAERQQQRVEQRVEGEADQATDEAVDSLMDKAMGKIFGE